MRTLSATLNPPIHFTSLQRYKRNMALQQPAPEPPPMESVDKPWAEHQIVRIIKAAMGDSPLQEGDKRKPDLNLARAALRDLYEANGWMAPKRTESLTANLHALAPGQLRAALQQACSNLPPAMQRELAQAEPEVITIPALPPAE